MKEPPIGTREGLSRVHHLCQLRWRPRCLPAELTMEGRQMDPIPNRWHKRPKPMAGNNDYAFREEPHLAYGRTTPSDAQ